MSDIRLIMSRYGLLGEPAFAQTRFAVEPIPCRNGCPIGLYDPDLNLITLEPDYNDAVVLHELGHRYGDVYRNDLSEEYAESFRKRYQGGVSLAAFMPRKGARMRAVHQAQMQAQMRAVHQGQMRAVHQAQMTMTRAMSRARGFPALSLVDSWSGVIYNVSLPPAAGKITTVLVWKYTDGTWVAPPLSIPSAGLAKPPMALTIYFQNTSPVNQNMRTRVQWKRPDGSLYKEDTSAAVLVAPGVIAMQQAPGGGGGWYPDVLGAWSAVIYLDAEAA
jgi:hypothetical protein